MDALGIRLRRPAHQAGARQPDRGHQRGAVSAPGFGDPFDIIRVCEELARLDLGDWSPAHLPYAAPAQPEDRA